MLPLSIKTKAIVKHTLLSYGELLKVWNLLGGKAIGMWHLNLTLKFLFKNCNPNRLMKKLALTYFSNVKRLSTEIGKFNPDTLSEREILQLIGWQTTV